MKLTPVQLPNANGQVNNCPVTKVSSQKIKWRLDNSRAIFQTLTSVEQENFDKFQNAIKQGLSPKEAAKKIVDAKYAKLKGTDNQYQISLSPKARATFIVNEKDHVVQILQVGYYT